MLRAAQSISSNQEQERQNDAMPPVIALKSKHALKYTRDVYCVIDSETAINHSSYRLLMQYRQSFHSGGASGNLDPADQGQI